MPGVGVRRAILYMILVLLILLLVVLIPYLPELFQEHRMILVAERIKHADNYVVLHNLSEYPYVEEAIAKGKALIPRDDDRTIKFLMMLSHKRTNVIRVDGNYYRISLRGPNESSPPLKIFYLPLR